MTKPFELIYSQQASDFVRGKVYANPRFYSTPRAGVSKVYLVGDWPKIRADYEALGVLVETVDLAGVTVTPGSAEAMPAPPPLPKALPEEDRDAIEIPADWQELTWPQLRKLAANFAPAVLNKADAAAAVEAELARREDE